METIYVVMMQNVDYDDFPTGGVALMRAFQHEDEAKEFVKIQPEMYRAVYKIMEVPYVSEAPDVDYGP